MTTFVNLKIFPTAVNTLGLYSLFWIHSGMCVLLSILAGLLLPETQGKTLTELSEMFEKKKKSPQYRPKVEPWKMTKEQEANMA